MILYKILKINDSGRQARREEEERLFKLYQSIEEMKDEFEEYVSSVKAELDLERQKIKAELTKAVEAEESVKKKRTKTKESNAKTEEDSKNDIKREVKNRISKSAEKDTSKTQKAKTTPDDNKETKVESVKRLHKEGLSLDDISKQLKISKGEVQLILNVN